MSFIKKIILKIIALTPALFSLHINYALANEAELKINDPAPEFKLYDQNRKLQTIND